jgi:hypothetical protein
MNQKLFVHLPCTRNDKSGLEALTTEIDLAFREVCEDGKVSAHDWSEEGGMAIITCSGRNADRLAEIARRTVAFLWKSGPAELIKGEAVRPH